AVLDVLASPAEWAARGLERAGRFSWEATARAHEDVYRELLWRALRVWTNRCEVGALPSQTCCNFAISIGSDQGGRRDPIKRGPEPPRRFRTCAPRSSQT